MFISRFSDSGVSTENVTITDSEVLAGEIFVDSEGKEQVGTMPNNGAIASTLKAGESYTVPKGYHDGTGKVTAANLVSQTDGTATAAQILTGQTAYVDGVKVTGTMANQGAKTSALNCGDSYTIPAGYHNGSGKVTANSLASQTSATAAAADIASGKTAWVNGNKVTGSSLILHEATGNDHIDNLTENSSDGYKYLDVSGLGFTPKFIIVRYYQGTSNGRTIYQMYCKDPANNNDMQYVWSAYSDRAAETSGFTVGNGFFKCPIIYDGNDTDTIYWRAIG